MIPGVEISVPLAQLTTRTYYQLARLESLTEWWHWLLLAAVSLLIASGAAALYRRDTRQVPSGTGWLVLVLRLVALAGLLVFFLNPQRRTEHRVVRPSRLAILVDTSQSMGLADVDSPESTAAATPRIEQIIHLLSAGSWLAQLRQKHEVLVYRFDQTESPVQVAAFSRFDREQPASDVALKRQRAERALLEARGLWGVAGFFLFVSCIALAAHGLARRRRRADEFTASGQLVSVVTLIVAVVVLAVANLRQPDIGWSQVVGRSPVTLDDDASPTRLTATQRGARIDPEDQRDSTATQRPAGVPSDNQPDSVTTDWQSAFAARGVETRLGEAVRWVVQNEQGGPLAGIVLLSDGRNNAGIEPAAAAQLARDAEIPVFPIGIGTDQQPQNVRVADVEAPRRVYPGDKFTITGYLQAYGFTGRTIPVELVGDEGSEPTPHIIDQRRISVPGDGEMMMVQFELTPEQVGERIYRLRVVADPRDLDSRDNERSVKVETVSRQNRMLLFAGGPTREYRFVRNLLFRDSQTTLAVLLESAPPGAAQEADEVLAEFPSQPETLFEYDGLIAFDPDWRQLSRQQMELIDRWIAEKAAGAILIAGPVNVPQWTRSTPGDSHLDPIKALYPVTFYSSSAVIPLGRVSSESPWPLEFTEQGLQAEFLQLEDSSAMSQEAWSRFSGVYSYHAVKDLKPGGEVYARFSDPQSRIDDQLPIYMAGQFYGAGRVFYLASGEMWRLRTVDERYFETFYTKLIRYVTQGRLLRDSSRGVLIVDKERCLVGDPVIVRASLSDAQFRPLDAPQVNGSLVQPDGSRANLVLRQAAQLEREGTFAGQFVATQEGDYRIELMIPDSADELLTRDVRVRIPQRELETPQRHDALLAELANQTGGAYYVGIESALGKRGLPPLANRLAVKDQVTYLPGTPDARFDQRLNFWLMVLVSGALCVEWLVRRLNRLA